MELEVGTEVRFLGCDGVVTKLTGHEEFPYEVTLSTGRVLYFTSEKLYLHECKESILLIKKVVPVFKWLYTNAFNDTNMATHHMSEEEVKRMAINMIRIEESREERVEYR